MAFFDELKDKAMDLGRAGVAKSRQLAEIAKLNLANSKVTIEENKSRIAELKAEGNLEDADVPPVATDIPPEESGFGGDDTNGVF